jgi:ATP-dependent Clp protease adaptor protein ClpS
MMNTLADIQFEEDVLVDEVAVTTSKLIVHNDEVNTFDWVIQALIDVCKHTTEQAEQCSYLIHYKGKYAVKHGSLSTLKPMKDAITERGISATIES